MLYGEVVGIYSDRHSKRINTLCGQNVQALSVKQSGTNSDIGAVKD